MNNEKISDFLKDVLQGRFKDFEQIVDQATVMLTIEKLCVENEALESIKHLLNNTQITEIDKIISLHNDMKAKLYGKVIQV